jgi:hypothetical protein
LLGCLSINQSKPIISQPGNAVNYFVNEYVKYFA